MFTAEPTLLDRRVAAGQTLLDGWKGRPYDFAGRVHCARMLAEHLRRMGHVPPLAKAGTYKTELGALRALKRAGFETIADVLDSMGLPRIAPAAALVGDIVQLPGEGPFGAFTVAMGNGRTLGFHQDVDQACVLQPVAFVDAWRIDPR